MFFLSVTDEMTLLYLGHETEATELRLAGGSRLEATVSAAWQGSAGRHSTPNKFQANNRPTAVALVLNPKGKRFDDGRWHHVVLSRRPDQVSSHPFLGNRRSLRLAPQSPRDAAHRP